MAQFIKIGSYTFNAEQIVEVEDRGHEVRVTFTASEAHYFGESGAVTTAHWLPFRGAEADALHWWLNAQAVDLVLEHRIARDEEGREATRQEEWDANAAADRDGMTEAGERRPDSIDMAREGDTTHWHDDDPAATYERWCEDG